MLKIYMFDFIFLCVFREFLIEIPCFAFVDIIMSTIDIPLITAPLLRDLRLHSLIDKVSLKEESSNFMDSPSTEPRAHAIVAQFRDSLDEYENGRNFEKSGKEPIPSSNIHVIEVNSTNQNVWILDTGCGSHLCNRVQGLRNPRPLEKGEVDLRVGNGAKVAAVSVGTFVIKLPSGFEMYLNNCYFVPQLTKNIISVSVLDSEGFSFMIENQTITFSFDDLVYGQATLSGGIYILDNQTEINHITSKKLKKGDPNLSYLWHCRLGHINDKRVQRLVSTSALPSFDFDSYGICESCLLGKMTRSPFLGKGTRASDLLILIHTDVIGPMSITARGGYGYFITFTDDLSRYGYVYLIKHKSEAFEKFKEFQNEVENQLSKKIKALRSDRGDEYLSYEFDDHL